MVLRLSPELVKHHADVPEIEFGNPFEPAARAWTMLDRSRPGHIGIPAAATAEKGEGLFQCFSDGLMELIDRIVQWDGKSWNG
jgi:creatinine amidohydrolase